MLETSARSLPSPGMEILRRRGTTSDVTIYESNGKLIGCKSVAERSWPFRRIVGRRLIRREMEIYRVLKGVTGIPVLIGPTGEDGFLFEYRPGTIFSRYTSESRMPDVFLAGLEDTVREMHARGVAHGDLFNRENILVGPDFTATIFDFGIAIRRDARFPPFSASLFKILSELDRRAVMKYRLRHGGGEGGPTRRARPHPLERMARGLKRLNILHKARKERRKRRETKEVIHLGEEPWRSARGPGTRIRWNR
ncbi:MAG: hypothetical protein O7H41_07635 [Planctomycetota bacterium]|nr:hypothetical protein [Planctomycetota bacterium]